MEVKVIGAPVDHQAKEEVDAVSSVGGGLLCSFFIVTPLRGEERVEFFVLAVVVSGGGLVWLVDVSLFQGFLELLELALELTNVLFKARELL